MGHNSVLGADRAPRRAKGTGEDALGPGDSTDSGSDMAGADRRAPADPLEPVDLTIGRDRALAPVERDGDDAPDEAADIGVDQVFDTDTGAEFVAGPIDEAMAPDPLDDEEDDEDDADDDAR
ncbi:hypothetical protein [Pelomonas sp. KK5]|uniref:hypothetical protein n=1 Tax=Pelomonas sp. KK5 TaxID=1855730 RepID=UPI00097CA790|nr:hypothetical protein [Pelomonas sp. KK5]